MAPCVPQDVVGTMDCFTNSVLVTWLPSLGAQSYTVLTQGTDGYNSSCISSEPSCNVPDLRCGVLYTLSVTASNGHCPSQANTAFEIRTAPCELNAISAISQCHSDIIQVTWDSVEDLPLYIATAEGNDRSILTCSGTMSSCDLMGAQCGTHYTIIVAASADNCSSLRSPPFKISTAPCAPEDVVAHADCESQGVLVSWAPSLVAESYQLTAMGRDGDLRECNTTDTNCILEELQCGRPYSLSVIASTENCTSPASLEVTFNSVPCNPDSLSVEAECGHGSAVLTWTESEGSMEYFASAQGENGDMLFCDSMDMSCTIEGLECGAMYNFSVQSSDGICNGSVSQILLERSVLCKPQNVSAQLDCSTNTARVEWEGSIGAESYVVLAIANQGHVTQCTTTGLACELMDLTCGCVYNVSVVAHNEYCNISESAITQLQTVPCPPQQLETSVDCDTGIITVSWEHSYGATSYTAVAQGNGGYTSYCNTSDTVCQFTDLLCDMTYSFTVSASDDNCTSTESSPVYQNTILCEPQNVSAKLNCSTNTAHVEWEQGEGVASYHVEAVGPDGRRTQCNSSSTSCQLPELHCGQRYNLTVTAQDQLCDNSNSYLTLQSALPPPIDVKTRLFPMQNESQIMRVSWSPVDFPNVTYLAEVTGNILGYGLLFRLASQDQYNVSSYWTSATFYEFLLPCSSFYSVTVRANSSAPSEAKTGKTAPCPPLSVKVEDKLISWQASVLATHYTVYEQLSTGRSQVCKTEDPTVSCTLSRKVKESAIKVTASNDSGESNPSGNVRLNKGIHEFFKDIDTNTNEELLEAEILKFFEAKLGKKLAALVFKESFQEILKADTDKDKMVDTEELYNFIK